MPRLRALLPAILTGLLLLLPGRAHAQSVVPDSAMQVVYLGEDVEITNGAWVEPGDPWRVVWEWTGACVGTTRDINTVHFGVADVVRVRDRATGKWQHAGAVTFWARGGSVYIIWRRDQTQFIDQIVHEMIHAHGGPAAGEFPPGSPTFSRCLPSLRFHS